MILKRNSWLSLRSQARTENARGWLGIKAGELTELNLAMFLCEDGFNLLEEGDAALEEHAGRTMPTDRGFAIRTPATLAVVPPPVLEVDDGLAMGTSEDIELLFSLARRPVVDEGVARPACKCSHGITNTFPPGGGGPAAAAGSGRAITETTRKELLAPFTPEAE